MLRISKCLKHQVLLDGEEMQSLFTVLGDFFIYLVSHPVRAEEMQVSRRDFLALYERYVEGIKRGNPEEDRWFRAGFSSVWTVDSSFLYAMPVGEMKFLVKPLRPVLQLQLHRFLLSEVDEKIHPLVLGKESVSWGIQFSYPQLYQDPKSQEISKIPRDFPNTILYWQLSRWLRAHTLPTAFFFHDKRIVSSLRLGKKCIPWIGSHPQLKCRNIQCALN